MTHGRIRLRELATLAAPVVIGQVSHILVGFADTWMVGKTGQVALAGLGLAAPVFLVGFLFFSALFQGTQTLCARRLGEDNLEETGTVLSSALVLALLVGIPASLIGIFLPEVLMPGISDDAATAEVAADYLQYRWGGGMWLIVIAFVFRGFYWGLGLTRTDLFVSVLFNGANVFLNWVFIFGNLGSEPMGAAGAGLASAIANALSVAVFAALTMRHVMRKKYATFRARPQKGIAVRVLRLSLPRSVQALAFTHAIVFFKIVNDAAGTTGLAISAVIWRFLGFTVLVSLGIGTATATLVGRELGRGNPDEAARFGWIAVKLGVGVVTIIAAVFSLFAEQILGEFLTVSHALSVYDGNRPTAELVAIGVMPFLVMLVFQIIDSVGIILSRALNGAGEVLYVMYAEIGIAWIVCIPATLLGAWALADSAPLMGAWWGWGAYCVAWAGAMAWRWRRGSWRSIQV